MKKIYFIFTSIFLLLLALIFQQYSLEKNDTEKVSTMNYKYHIQVIHPDNGEYFWKEFKQGAVNASDDLNVYVEFVSIGTKDAKLYSEAVEKGIMSNVDAIALQAEDKLLTTEAVKKAKEKGIAILTYENDSFFVSEASTVGSNSYDIGYMMGTLATNVLDGRGKASVLVKNWEQNIDDSYKNIKIQGVIDAVASFPNMKIDDVYTLNSGKFEVDILTKSILESNKRPQIIICTDELSTPAVAQVIVDLNMVGKVYIIGYGAMPKTLEYIERGVIVGSICPNAESIGYNTVKQLFDELEDNKVNDYFNTDIFLIDKSNINDFKGK